MSSINTSLSSLGVARSLATAQNQLATAMFRLSTALPNPEEKPANQSDQVSLNIGRYLGGLDEQLRSLSESLAIGQSAEAMIGEVSIALDELSAVVSVALDPEIDTEARQRLQQDAEAVRTRLDARVAEDALPERASDQKVSSSDNSDSEGVPAAVPRIDVMTPEGALQSAERIEEARQTLQMFEARIGVILDRLEASVTNLRQITESFSSAQSLERLRAMIEQRSGQWDAVHDKANKDKVLLLLRPDDL
jgi:flagellin-like hook-associated protein FlgL